MLEQYQTNTPKVTSLVTFLLSAINSTFLIDAVATDMANMFTARMVSQVAISIASVVYLASVNKER